MHGTHVQPATATTAPVVLVAVAYTPLVHSVRDTGHLTAAGSWSVKVTRRRGEKWEPVRSLTGDDLDPIQAWHRITSSAGSGGRPYVVCDAPADLLTLLGFWQRVDAGEVSLRLARSEYTDKHGKRRKRRPHPLILSGVPEVIGWEHSGREFRAVSYRNHLPMPLESIAPECGIQPPFAADCVPGADGRPLPVAAWQAKVLSAAYQHLISRWVNRRWGRWCDTIGAAAFALWRTTVEPKSVVIHQCGSAAASESAAVFGGRAQVFYFGPAGPNAPPTAPECDPCGEAWPTLAEPLYRVDVRSMYASILRDAEFPVALSHEMRRPTLRDLTRAVRSVHVLASVRVRLESPSLPYRRDDGTVCYPVGEWDTVLAHPELVVALDRGEVVRVNEAWVYRYSRPFTRFASDLIGARAEFRESGHPVAATYCKLLANALGGRLGATRRGWVTETDKICRRRWGEWSEVDGDDGECHRIRGVAGVRQRFVTRPDRTPGLTACYAWLTAYGRVRLRALLDAAGSRSVLACDTDGFVLTGSGLERLKAGGHVGDGSPGLLRIEGEVGHFHARTPKHYFADGSWTLAGVRADFAPADVRSVRHYVSASPVRSATRPAHADLTTRAAVFRVDTIPLSGTPGIDGWLIPPVVSGRSIHQPTDTRGERVDY